MLKPEEELIKLLNVMDKLLGEGGCPWDREQTHESLSRYLIEEAYEVIDAIQAKDMDSLQEELGDVLLQVVFHAALAAREGQFDFADVAATVHKKMRNRHPHVFGNMQLDTSAAVMEKWEDFKKKEGKKSVLEGIPNCLPALMRAEKMQAKASRVGFDWPDVSGALDKLKEETQEFINAASAAQKEEEMGDLFFTLVNIARFQGIDPEQALQKSNDKFMKRFNYIEQQINAGHREWSEHSLKELDALWDAAKKEKA